MHAYVTVSINLPATTLNISEFVQLLSSQSLLMDASFQCLLTPILRHLGTDIHSADDIIATNDSHGSIYNKKEAKFDIDDSSSVSSDSSISIVTDNGRKFPV